MTGRRSSAGSVTDPFHTAHPPMQRAITTIGVIVFVLALSPGKWFNVGMCHLGGTGYYLGQTCEQLRGN